MLESIASCCRVIACDARLVLLWHLIAEPELRVYELAERARVPTEHTSQHLRRLVAVELLRRRRSGRYIYYRLHTASSPTVSFAPGDLVQRAFLDAKWATRGWEEKRIIHLSPRTASVLPNRALRTADVIFDAATAFSQVRRLQILRSLAEEGPRPMAALGESLHMSPQACWRHLDKLRRRGYVCARSAGLWSLSATHQSALHKSLLGEVRMRWGQGSHT